MKLIVSIVHGDDADQLLQALREWGFRSTKINSSGGFLREGNATILVGTDESKVDDALSVIRQNCHRRTEFMNPLPPTAEPDESYLPNPVEVQVGGATIFVLDVERFERF